ncbi:uncharacterized protein LOC128227024 isoform X1 [Mya arenaria]|uniref:uncharacterized protein LOC128227024 isoform X1 n=1 Tax=Mya arenaria TaxID=6604 RepID=UPI0022DEB6AD|nr:uncharacterized protein LOC128227024 isoform X1 [Mya arenaria]
METQVEAISSDLKQIQTTSKFVLKRLNQLRDSGHGCNCKEKLQVTQTEITTVSTRVDELQSHHTSLVDTQNDIQKQINEMRARMEEMQQTLLTVQTDDSKLQKKSGQTDNGTDTVSEEYIASAYFTNGAEHSEPLHTDVETSEKGPKADLDVKPVKVDTKTNTESGTTPAPKGKNSGTTLRIETKSAEHPVSIATSTQSAKLSSGDKMVGRPNFPSKPAPSANETAESKETTEGTKKDEGAEGSQVEVVRQTRKEFMLMGEPGWRSLGQTTLDEATQKMTDLEGVNAVICLDISESMATGNAWTQARTFICNYLAGLEECRREYASHGLEVQNVALVTFGHETKIQTLFTSDYNNVRNILDNLKLGGPSPMFGGLLYAMAAGWAPKRQQMMINGIMVNTKIILVTDGRPTELSLIAGPDMPDNDMDPTKASILQVVQRFDQMDIELFCIPVGDCDREFIELMSNVAEGKVKDVNYGRRLARRLHLCIKRSGFKNIQSDGISGVLQSELLGLLTTDDSRSPVMTSCHRTLVDHLGLSEGLLSGLLPQDPSLSEEDKEDMKEIQEDSKRNFKKVVSCVGRSGLQDIYRDVDSKTLPAVGTRVRRGPDWHWRQQDSDGPGTVIGHSSNDGRVWVEWDADANTNIYCYRNGHYDLLIVDEPRVPPPGKKVAVGCLVKPGKDGRSTGKNVWDSGVVVKMDPPKALVRWDDGKRGDYSYGEDGKYEIEFCNSSSSASGGYRLDSTPVVSRQTTNFPVGGDPKTATATPRKNKNKNKNANVNR